jgi:hypothetical protein
MTSSACVGAGPLSGRQDVPEFRQKLATYKFGNTLIMPLLVIISGIVIAILRRRTIAAR